MTTLLEFDVVHPAASLPWWVLVNNDGRTNPESGSDARRYWSASNPVNSRVDLIVRLPSALAPERRISLPPSVLASKTLIVGTPEQNPPVIYKNGGQVDGLGADLINSVATTLGLHIEYVNTAFPGLFAALDTGKIDVLAEIELADTAQRETQAIIISRDIATGSLLTPKANPRDIQRVADLCGLTAETLRGSNYASRLATESAHCESTGKQPITIKLYPDAPSTLTRCRPDGSTP